MRVWNLAKLTGQSPESVEGWDADWFLWAEAIEQHWANEQRKQMRKR